MPKFPKLVRLVVKHDNQPAEALGKVIATWLGDQNIRCCSGDSGACQPDLIVVLGGDGTILGAARQHVGENTAIFGINFGQVGFLTATEPCNWQHALLQAIRGRMPLRNCLALKWTVNGPNKRNLNGAAVNDVVISRGALARLINLGIKVNGHDMGGVRSDGCIITSPLGSAGYSASAGGSLIYPGMQAMGLTSICSFPARIPPFLFPPEYSIEITVEAAGPTHCNMTIDGQEGLELEAGDLVNVQGWPGAVRIFGSDRDFFARLGARGFTAANN